MRSSLDPRQRNAESSVADWQLPSLNFRPLSFATYAQSNPDRPKSAEGVRTVRTTEIISPTPERPVSSQSRRRFSKILGIVDDHHSMVSTISRPYNSMNFARLKRVAEVPESAYPARFSIPPYSPRRSTIAEGMNEDDADGDGLQDTASSQATSNANSTVELLLDRHILCLGLLPDVSTVDSGSAQGHKNEGVPLTTSRSESTIKVSGHEKQDRDGQARPKTASSAYPSTMASPEREFLIPRKLFSSGFYPTAVSSRGWLTGARSLPCMSEAASSDQPADRLSLGWHSLASTAQLLSPTTRCMLEGHASENPHEQSPGAGKYQIRRRSRVALSPSTSSRWSKEMDNTYDLDDAPALQRQKRRNEYLVRHTSERRKVRARLKLKKSLISQNRVGNSESPNTHTSLDTAQPSIDTGIVDEKRVRNMVQDVTLPADATEAQAWTRKDQESDCETAMINGQQVASSPGIPHRQSSAAAGAVDVLQPSTDIPRLTSTRTACSHRSNASLAEPINSTRPSVQMPRPSTQTSGLAPLDIPPSLSSLNLDMSVRYPDIVATPRPVLRETRSFFSDDSSAIHKHRGSLRNRFHLHSLRSVLPSSPRRTMVNDGADMTPPSNVTEEHHSRQTRGTRSEEEERDLYGTIGMTDFAYRKKKIIERLKDWWKRHSMQRKLGLKRKKSTKNIASGEVGSGYKDV